VHHDPPRRGHASGPSGETAPFGPPVSARVDASSATRPTHCLVRCGEAISGPRPGASLAAVAPAARNCPVMHQMQPGALGRITLPVCATMIALSATESDASSLHQLHAVREVPGHRGEVAARRAGGNAGPTLHRRQRVFTRSGEYCI
jgi:hypothetical protein